MARIPDPAPGTAGAANGEAGIPGARAGLAAEDELTLDVSVWDRRRRRLIVCLVAAFIISPDVALVTNHGFTGKALFVVPASVVFVAVMGRNMIGREPSWSDPRGNAGWIAAFTVLGAAVFVVGGMNWLTTLAVSAAVFGNLLVRTRLAVWGIVGCCAVGLGVATWQRLGYGNTLAATAIPVLAGLLSSWGARRSYLVARLHQTRAELARMAVADERLRIARDLHDLLGHSLSLISLKAELAGRLIGTDTTRAAREISELETVARRSLAEVRQAVTSYRQPNLAAELAAARRMLASAGVDCRVEVPGAYSLPPAVDALLAWAVREGATNIVRHAAARHAEIEIELTAGHVAAVLTDDGGGPPAAVPDVTAPAAGSAPAAGAADEVGLPVGGSGLAGLAERAARLGGTLSAGAGRRGGFRLVVSVPQSGAGSPAGRDDASGAAVGTPAPPAGTAAGTPAPPAGALLGRDRPGLT